MLVGYFRRSFLDAKTDAMIFEIMEKERNRTRNVSKKAVRLRSAIKKRINVIKDIIRMFACQMKWGQGMRNLMIKRVF
jgi:hypothetical protein